MKLQKCALIALALLMLACSASAEEEVYIYTISSGDTVRSSEIPPSTSLSKYYFVESEATLIVDDYFNCSSSYLENYGNITIEENSYIGLDGYFELGTGAINNYGTLIVYGGISSGGTIINMDGGTIINMDSGTISNYAGSSLVNHDNSIIHNYGRILADMGEIINEGTVIIIDGWLDYTYGRLANYGTVIVDVNGSIISGGPGGIDNYGNLTIRGSYASSGSLTNHNNGIIHNYGWMRTYDSDYGQIIYNYGTFYMHSSGSLSGDSGSLSGYSGNPIIYDNVPVTSITIAGASTAVENGKTLQMTAAVAPATATNKDVTWSVTSETGTATISPTGLLTGTKAGTVTVKATAKDGSGVQGSLLITVTAVPVTVIPVTGIELSSATTTIENGKTLQMTAAVAPATATNKNVTWSVVAGTGTATISPTGFLTGTKAGTVTVKATALDGSGVEGSTSITIAEEIVPVKSITVTGAATTVENGKTLQMTATVTPATATNKDVTWSVVASTGNATISPTGLLTGTKAGTVTIKAIAKDGSGVQGSSVVTVIEIPVTGIALSEAATTVENGKTLQMIATVYPENATNKNVLWSVESITGDAVISETGLLTGKAAGNVTVRVTSVANSNVKDALNITVTEAKTVSSKSGGGGGGGSGGSGSSGEKTQNIALKDVSSIFVGKGSVRFDFKDTDNDVQYIEYTALKNSGTISATVEILKDKSTFAASSPEGVIYRHINIWLGKTGYATETNIESPVVGFRVDKEWIADHDIDPVSVVLNRYSNDKWNALSTTQTKSDEKYYYYQAETPGFSPFAITGVSLDDAALRSTSNATFTADEGNVQEGSAGNESQAENKLPGFSLTVTLLIVSIACFLKRRQ